jgi:hypothetical protein
MERTTFDTDGVPARNHDIETLSFNIFSSEKRLHKEKRIKTRNPRLSNDLHVLHHLVHPKLVQGPMDPEPRPKRHGALRLSERIRELVQRVVPQPHVERVREGVRGRIEESGGERAHVMSEDEFHGRVKRGSGDDILEVDREAFFQTVLHLTDGIFRVPIEYVKVTDSLFAKERSGHRTMES